MFNEDGWTDLDYIKGCTIYVNCEPNVEEIMYAINKQIEDVGSFSYVIEYSGKF